MADEIEVLQRVVRLEANYENLKELVQEDHHLLTATNQLVQHGALERSQLKESLELVRNEINGAGTKIAILQQITKKAEDQINAIEAAKQNPILLVITKKDALRWGALIIGAILGSPFLWNFIQVYVLHTPA
jgi:adenosine/AMP kinase